VTVCGPSSFDLASLAHPLFGGEFVPFSFFPFLLPPHTLRGDVRADPFPLPPLQVISLFSIFFSRYGWFFFISLRFITSSPLWWFLSTGTSFPTPQTKTLFCPSLRFLSLTFFDLSCGPVASRLPNWTFVRPLSVPPPPLSSPPLDPFFRSRSVLPASSPLRFWVSEKPLFAFRMVCWSSRWIIGRAPPPFFVVVLPLHGVSSEPSSRIASGWFRAVLV